MSKITLIPRLKEALSEVRRVKSIAGTAMLAALNLVLNQFTIMVSQMLEIGFAFLTAACAAYLYGPWLAGLAGIVTDTIGYLFRPNGPYFPFFAINEFLLGFIYGCWFYKKPVTLLRTFLACLTVVLVINLCLSPIWLNMMYGNAAIISGIRLIKNMIKLPVDTLLLYTILKTLEKRRHSFGRA